MTSAEADADVALESNVVTGGEFESVERSNKHARFRILDPFAENGRVGGAAILVRHQVSVVVVRDGITVTGESTINA